MGKKGIRLQVSGLRFARAFRIPAAGPATTEPKQRYNAVGLTLPGLVRHPSC
jgi:hypothetical protein